LYLDFCLILLLLFVLTILILSRSAELRWLLVFIFTNSFL
jgi:hypothetical protein